MCYNQTGDISTLDGTSLKLVDKFTYLGSSVSSTEKDIDTRLTKAWTAIDRLSIIWKSDLIDKIKRSFFQPAVVSVLLYGCTTWTLTKRLKKKLDGNYTRIGAFGTVIKGLLKGLEDLEVSGSMEAIQTIALLRTARIQKRILET